MKKNECPFCKSHEVTVSTVRVHTGKRGRPRHVNAYYCTSCQTKYHDAELAPKTEEIVLPTSSAV
jgi:transcriptional regulator NrdR family protein